MMNKEAGLIRLIKAMTILCVSVMALSISQSIKVRKLKAEKAEMMLGIDENQQRKDSLKLVFSELNEINETLRDSVQFYKENRINIIKEYVQIKKEFDQKKVDISNYNLEQQLDFFSKYRQSSQSLPDIIH